MSATYTQRIGSTRLSLTGYAGYRFGTVVPYASYAATVKSKPYDNVASLSGDQSTEALGVHPGTAVIHCSIHLKGGWAGQGMR